MRIIGNLSLVALIVLGMAAEARSETVVIGGRVCDHVNKPVPGTKVKLKDADGQVLESQATDSDGRFLFEKPECKTCSLEIIPNPKKTLETALINGIPGDKPRQFAVRLERGFALHGRVVHKGKGLKGVTVRAMPTEITSDKGTIHGGGTTTTDGAGRFTMILTPGDKNLTIVNDRYRELAGKITHSLTITADKDVPDLELYDAPKVSTGKTP
jgi:hypothetical protein